MVRTKLPNGRTLRLWSQGDDWISTQIFWNGWNAYETETLDLFFRLALTARIVFDIGAHVGLFALIAAHANPEGDVFAFEPNPSTYQRLQYHVWLNQLSNIRCLNSAMGDVNCTAELFHQPGMTSTASLSRDFMDWQKTWSSSSVPVVTGDKFIRDNEIHHVDLVKIDTESTEPQVLKGMMKTLERDRPNIICEVLPSITQQSLQKILLPLGYHFYQLTDRGLIWRDTIMGELEFRNYLFSQAGPDAINRVLAADNRD
jgi:FkbM family methyltransferase